MFFKSVVLIALVFSSMVANADLDLPKCATAIQKKIKNGKYHGYLRSAYGVNSRTCIATFDNSNGKLTVRIDAVDQNLQTLSSRKFVSFGGADFECTGNKNTPIIVSRAESSVVGQVHSLQVFDQEIVNFWVTEQLPTEKA